MRLIRGLVIAIALCFVGVTLAPASRMSAEEPKKAPEKTAEKTEKTEKAPSFKNDVAPLLSAACSNCHSGKRKKAGLDVESFDSIAKFVKAGEPDKSRLHNSLLGKGAKLMPPKNPLDDKEVAVIRAWIVAGAKKD